MKHKRNVYLKMKSLAEARKIFFDRFSQRTYQKTETVSTPDAVGRVLAESLAAAISAPGYHAAAMDGVAVKAADTFGASEQTPKTLTIGNGAVYVNTGHILPESCDAVIMIENIQASDDEKITVEAPAYPWQHVRKMGEDMVATELLFPQNHLVTPYCVGALLTGGLFRVPVRIPPLVSIIPTGSELVDWRTLSLRDLKPGEVIETNAYVLGKMAEAIGGCFERAETLTDDVDLIRSTVISAVDSDAEIVLILGGSSAGSEDFARHVIEELGTIWVHGVTMMPGKPVILGEINNKPVVGIPGYPVSAILAFEQFVAPLICCMLGQPESKRPTIDVTPTRKIASKLGVEEFVRVKLGQVAQTMVATPLPRGAGTITSITEADGIIRIPAHVEGLSARQPVAAELIRPESRIANTIVAVGSHDNALDVLADELRAGHQGRINLSSSHVGSIGGLMAIKKKGCHIAGAHLLDETDGSYNISYVKKVLKDTPVALVTLLQRDQGLIVLKGNPKNIRGIEDLGRPDVRFVNRQSGSGTRILLDFKLSELGVDPDDIHGYTNEEYTHMSVAVAVLSQSVDAGLGIFAAAKALGLDFIPVVTEQYDLVIPRIYMDTEPIGMLLNTISSDSFQKRVKALGGYDLSKTGETIFVE
ncbi:MAG: molybdopterin biosynthesis protein [Deltaproteobacteria bacterium]|nr:molybdopterin biosynthesis protein [Deltaproteobacteria bacterium]